MGKSMKYTLSMVNNCKILLLVLLLTFVADGWAMTIKKTDSLKVYYPDYSKIDLVCGQMPQPSDKEVVFCCEGAFTGELLKEFKHSNIGDNHICQGVMKKGFRCRAQTGGFVWATANGSS